MTVNMVKYICRYVYCGNNGFILVESNSLNLGRSVPIWGQLLLLPEVLPPVVPVSTRSSRSGGFHRLCLGPLIKSCHFSMINPYFTQMPRCKMRTIFGYCWQLFVSYSQQTCRAALPWRLPARPHTVDWTPAH